MFQRNLLGALTRITVHDSQSNLVQEKAFCYNKGGYLDRAASEQHISSWDYALDGRLMGQYVRHINLDQDKQNGLPPTQWDDENQDPLHFHQTRNLTYYYNNLNLRDGLELPDHRRLDCFYYGSGHLHNIALRDKRVSPDIDPLLTTISDMERDGLHREIYRTQGSLSSRYEFDPVGRLLQQFAFMENHNDNNPSGSPPLSGVPSSVEGSLKDNQTAYAIQRSYAYDKLGNLSHSRDKRTGLT